MTVSTRVVAVRGRSEHPRARLCVDVRVHLARVPPRGLARSWGDSVCPLLRDRPAVFQSDGAASPAPSDVGGSRPVRSWPRLVAVSLERPRGVRRPLLGVLLCGSPVSSFSRAHCSSAPSWPVFAFAVRGAVRVPTLWIQVPGRTRDSRVPPSPLPARPAGGLCRLRAAPSEAHGFLSWLHSISSISCCVACRW